MVITVFGLDHHLSAGTARRLRVGCEVALGIASDGKAEDGFVRERRSGSEQSTAFGAQAAGIGSVLLVTATNNLAVFE